MVSRCKSRIMITFQEMKLKDDKVYMDCLISSIFFCILNCNVTGAQSSGVSPEINHHQLDRYIVFSAQNFIKNRTKNTLQIFVVQTCSIFHKCESYLSLVKNRRLNFTNAFRYKETHTQKHTDNHNYQMQER